MSTRILLVDDATETRNFLAESILSPEGYEVYTAANGTEAIDLVREVQPALIISDYLMPKVTGLDLLKNLKDNGINIPFILITAEGSEALAVQAMRLGVKDYLIKPFDIGDLLDSINAVLEEYPIPPKKKTVSLENILNEITNPILITDDHHTIYYTNTIFQKLFITQSEILLLKSPKTKIY